MFHLLSKRLLQFNLNWRDPRVIVLLYSVLVVVAGGHWSDVDRHHVMLGVNNWEQFLGGIPGQCYEPPPLLVKVLSSLTKLLLWLFLLWPKHECSCLQISVPYLLGGDGRLKGGENWLFCVKPCVCAAAVYPHQHTDLYVFHCTGFLWCHLTVHLHPDFRRIYHSEETTRPGQNNHPQSAFALCSASVLRWSIYWPHHCSGS